MKRPHGRGATCRKAWRNTSRLTSRWEYACALGKPEVGEKRQHNGEPVSVRLGTIGGMRANRAELLHWLALHRQLGLQAFDVAEYRGNGKHASVALVTQ